MVRWPSDRDAAWLSSVLVPVNRWSSDWRYMPRSSDWWRSRADERRVPPLKRWSNDRRLSLPTCCFSMRTNSLSWPEPEDIRCGLSLRSLRSLALDCCLPLNVWRRLTSVREMPCSVIAALLLEVCTRQTGDICLALSDVCRAPPLTDSLQNLNNGHLQRQNMSDVCPLAVWWLTFGL